MVLLSNGTVLAAGGQDFSGSTLASCEIYNPNTKTWAVAGSMTTPRYSFQMVVLSDATVLAAGGYNGTAYVASSEVTTLPPTPGPLHQLP